VADKLAARPGPGRAGRLAGRMARLLGTADDGLDGPDPSPLPAGEADPAPSRPLGTQWRRLGGGSGPARAEGKPAGGEWIEASRRHPAGAGLREASAGPRQRIDPRFRQRRIQVKREEGRRRLRLLVAGTTTLVLIAAGFGVLRSPLLRVRHVEVVGASRTPVAQVVAAAGLAGHRLMIDVNGRSGAVDHLPWIATARIHRSWPGTVVVTVTERRPVAEIGAPAVELVDATGRVVAPAPVGTALPRIEFGTVSGPGDASATGGGPAAGGPAAGGPAGGTPIPGGPGTQLPAGYRPGVTVAAALPGALASKVVAVVVLGGGAVGLRLSGGASAILGDPTDLGPKLEAVLTLVERVQIGTGTIDATVPTAPVLTPGRQIATFSTQTGG
jgi:cell division protein FtsQ